MSSAFVQAKSASNTGGVTNQTVTPDAGLTAGNTVMVDITYGHSSARTLSSIQDQSGNPLTFTRPVTGLFDAGPGAGAECCVIANLPSSVTAIKPVFSTTVDFGIAVTITEYSGVKTASVVDATGFAGQVLGGVATTANAVTSGSLTPTSQPGMLHGFAVNLNNATAPNAGTGFTSNANQTVNVVGAFGQRSEYKAISATSATAATFTNASTGGQGFAAFGILLLDAVSSVPTVTDFGDELHRVGETGVVITGTNFGATQATGLVKVCPSNSVSDVNGQTLTVTAWGDTSITVDIPASLSSLIPRNTNVFLFVKNDGGNSNATGYTFQVTPPPGVLAFNLLN